MLARVLRGLARGVVKYPGWFFFPQIILSALCVLYAVYGLKFDLSRDKLVGTGEKYFEIEKNFQKEFPGEDQLVLATGNDAERNRQFIERLAQRVEPETNLFTKVYYKSDLATLGPKALLLAPTSDLEQMRKSMDASLPFLQMFSQISNLDSLFGMVNQQLLSAGRGSAGHGEDLLKSLPALDKIVVAANQSMSAPGRPAVPQLGQLFGGGQNAEQGSYLTYDQGRIFALTFRFRNDAMISQGIERMRTLIRETAHEVPGVDAGLTGRSVLEYDQMTQSKYDTTVAAVAALVICSSIFIIAYREVRRPLKAAFCLLIGFGYTLGFTTLAVGHLNILSISFAPMLVGLGIDFGVQFITRYEEEMRNGLGIAEAISKTTIFTGQGIAIGGLTMAAAFLAMGLTHFKGIREVGIICGGGLLLCLFAMMTALPGLLILAHRKVGGHATNVASPTRLKIEKIWLQHPVVVVVIALLLCAASVWGARSVRFDYNLLHLQNSHLASVRFENKLLQSAGRSAMFASVMADSPQQALEVEQKLKSLPAVSHVDSVAGYLTGNEKNLEMVRAIKTDLANIHFGPIDRKPVQPAKLSGNLEDLQGYLEMAGMAAQQDNPDLAAQLLSFNNHLDEFRKKLDSGGPQITERLQHFQQALFAEIHGMIETLKNQDTSRPLVASDLPAVLRDRFIGTTGKYLLQVYPKKDIWQRPNQQEFIQQLQSVVPAEKMTGTPIMVYHHTALLKDSYQQAAWYSLAAIIIMLFLHFRSPGYVILALLPVGMGFVWLLGFMGATGLSFNPANIMALPLVIGVGVTNGIQILNRVAEEGEPGILTKSTGKAVLVSGLTAITGFGTLLLGKDQGVRSLGEVMPVGIGACMIAGLTFLPAVLILLERFGWVGASSRRETEKEIGAGWHWLRWRRR